MADLARNKEIAKSYFGYLTAGDVAGLEKILADNLRYWICGNLPGFSGSRNKSELLAAIGPFASMWNGPLTFTVTGETAEDNRVALEVTNDGVTHGGKRYNNSYHIAFDIEDGRISGIREYLDTAHAAEVLF